MKYRNRHTEATAEKEGNSLHYVIRYGGKYMFTAPHHVIEKSKDWEKVEDNAYEILSFKVTEEQEDPSIVTLQTDGLYVYEGWSGYVKGEGVHTLESMLKNVRDGEHIVYSVKRLSDGEVFTVGDRITDGAIHGIELDSKYTGGVKLCLSTTHANTLSLEYAKHVKPVFTSHDGNEMYVGDTYYWASWRDVVLANTILDHYRSEDFSEKVHRFSTREACQEYIDSKKVVDVKLTRREFNKLKELLK